MQEQLFALETELERKFNQFHQDNPHVYLRLVVMARALKHRGHRKIGIQMLFEVIRWESMMHTRNDEYKMNNSYSSRYARMIMEREPDLDGIFEIRELKS